MLTNLDAAEPERGVGSGSIPLLFDTYIVVVRQFNKEKDLFKDLFKCKNKYGKVLRCTNI